MKIIENNKYQIKVLDKQVNQDPNTPIPDYKSTFVWLISASKGSGKTTALINYLRSSDFYYRKFHNLFLLSATCNSDKKWQDNIDIEYSYQFSNSEWDNNDIERFIEIARETADDKKYSCCIIDDYASYLKSSNELKHWILNSRHLKTSFFICTQKYSLFPTYLRENADCFQIYQPNSSRELNFIKEDLLEPVLDKEQIKDLLKTVYTEQRDFLFVNNRHKIKDRFYKNFNKLILND